MEERYNPYTGKMEVFPNKNKKERDNLSFELLALELSYGWLTSHRITSKNKLEKSDDK